MLNTLEIRGTRCDMAWIVKYKDDMFVHGHTKGGKAHIWTKMKEKAEKYGMKLNRFNLYDKYVSMDEIEKVQPYLSSRHRVKYKEHFFPTGKEEETRVELIAPTFYLCQRYGLISNYDGMHGWVNKCETTPIDEYISSQRLCLCLRYSEKSHEIMGPYLDIVFEILDESDKEFLVASDATDRENTDGAPWDMYETRNSKGNMSLDPIEYGWEYINGKWQKWVARERVYVYGESDEPIRY